MSSPNSTQNQPILPAGLPPGPSSYRSKVSKIGIVGDVHAEHEGLAAALKHLTSLGAQLIICTGDIADGEGDLAACIHLLQAHNVITVRGNHDRWLSENKVRHIEGAHHAEDLDPPCLKYIRDLPSQVTILTQAGPLLLCHGMAANDLQKIWPGTERMPIERSATLDKIIAQQQARFIVNGHVHYRTMIHFEDTVLLNAGTLKRRHKAGFSFLDLHKYEISGFEFEPNIHKVKTLSLAAAEHTQIFSSTQSFDGHWQPVTLYA